MRVGTQEQAGGGAVTSVSTTSSVARGRGRVRPLVIVAVVTSAAISIAALAVSMRGEPAVSGVRPVAGPATADTGRSPLDASVAWVDGLAAGLIAPSDVTSRLARQDPRVAEAVATAWSDLDRADDSIVLDNAVTWIDGLAAGLILPSDVTSRLSARDPKTATAVTAAWSDLNGGTLHHVGSGDSR